MPHEGVQEPRSLQEDEEASSDVRCEVIVWIMHPM